MKNIDIRKDNLFPESVFLLPVKMEFFGLLTLYSNIFIEITTYRNRCSTFCTRQFIPVQKNDMKVEGTGAESIFVQSIHDHLHGYCYGV